LYNYSNHDTYASGKSLQNSLDYICTCGDVNLNITDELDNDFI